MAARVFYRVTIRQFSATQKKRFSGNCRDRQSGLPNLFGVAALYPQQVGDSGISAAANPNEPKKKRGTHPKSHPPHEQKKAANLQGR
jgi:hypothetical protein